MESLEIDKDSGTESNRPDLRRSLNWEAANLSIDAGLRRNPAPYSKTFQKARDEDFVKNSLGELRDERPQKDMSIAESVQKCVDGFQKLERSANYSRLPHTSENSGQEYRDMVWESFERFDIWKRNVGAHKRDMNSLDTRLYQASHLRPRIVLDYLHDIREGISDSGS